jgi:hypothetical protein
VPRRRYHFVATDAISFKYRAALTATSVLRLCGYDRWNY